MILLKSLIPNKFIISEGKGMSSNTHIGDAIVFTNNQTVPYILISNDFYADVSSSAEKMGLDTTIVHKIPKVKTNIKSGFIFVLESPDKTIGIVRYSKKNSGNYPPGKFELKWVKSSESFDIKPQSIIPSMLGKLQTIIAFKKGIIDGVNSRSDLDQGLKDYLVDITNKANGKLNISVDISQYIPTPTKRAFAQIEKNFAEMISAIEVCGKTDKIYIPKAGNEPLLDFRIYKNDGTIMNYSAKSKSKSANTVKLKSIKDTIDSDKTKYEKFMKGKFKIVYDVLTIASTKTIRGAYYPLFELFDIKFDDSHKTKWGTFKNLSKEDKIKEGVYVMERSKLLFAKLNTKTFKTLAEDVINSLVTVDFVISDINNKTGSVTTKVKAATDVSILFREKNYVSFNKQSWRLDSKLGFNVK